MFWWVLLIEFLEKNNINNLQCVPCIISERESKKREGLLSLCASQCQESSWEGRRCWTKSSSCWHSLLASSSLSPACVSSSRLSRLKLTSAPLTTASPFACLYRVLTDFYICRETDECKFKIMKMRFSWIGQSSNRRVWNQEKDLIMITSMIWIFQPVQPYN